MLVVDVTDDVDVVLDAELAEVEVEVLLGVTDEVVVVGEEAVELVDDVDEIVVLVVGATFRKSRIGCAQAPWSTITSISFPFTRQNVSAPLSSKAWPDGRIDQDPGPAGTLLKSCRGEST